MLVFEVTKTQEEVKQTISSLFQDFLHTATEQGLTLSPTQYSQIRQTLKQRVLSGSEARDRLAQMGSPSPEIAAQAMTHLMNLANIDTKDIISDEQAAKNAGHDSSDTDGDIDAPPVTPSTLPSVVNTELAAAGVREVDFTQVKHLPGYLREPIRVMGRQIFSTFTNIPIEDISVIANINGSGGPNETSEINAVAGYARKYGQKDTQAEMNFNSSMPGYDAEVAIYTAEGITYMMVKDFMGQYIYSWPAESTKRLKENARVKPGMIALQRLAKAIQRRLMRHD